MPLRIHQLIRSERKTIAIIVDHEGRLIVRAPMRVSRQTIQAFVDEKADWILEKQALARNRPTAPAARAFADGETFWYLGGRYPLRLAPRGPAVVEWKDNSFHLAASAQPQAAAALEVWYRRQAKLILTERTALWAKRCGFTYAQVKITAARTRWGSCSSRGVISYPWRLIMAPLAMIDYVIVHELVHTVAHNHGPHFWAGVAAILPDYEKSIAWFKQNGHLLTL